MSDPLGLGSAFRDAAIILVVLAAGVGALIASLVWWLP